MATSIVGIDRQPPATTGNHWQAGGPQRWLPLLAAAPVARPLQLQADAVLAGASFSQALQVAAQTSGRSDADIAGEIHICAGYMSRCMRGVWQAWAQRLVKFVAATGSLAPIQWLAIQCGCELVPRDSRAAEVAALQARLRELAPPVG